MEDNLTSNGETQSRCRPDKMYPSLVDGMKQKMKKERDRERESKKSESKIPWSWTQVSIFYAADDDDFLLCYFSYRSA